MGSNREKFNIAIAIFEKLPLRVTKIISHFDGSNNIFADCTLLRIYFKNRFTL